MISIPGFMVNTLTFPGVIVREFFHRIICRLYKIPVYKVNYFSFEQIENYITYDSIKHPVRAVMIALVPFLLSTQLGIIVTLTTTMDFFISPSLNTLLACLNWKLWLGLSMAIQAFPSRGVVERISYSFRYSFEYSLFKFFFKPLKWFFYLGNFGLNQVFALLIIAWSGYKLIGC